MELYLPPQRRIRDERGRFVKNHPRLTASSQPLKKVTKKKISKSLKKAFREGRCKPPKYTGKPVIVIREGKFIGRYESATKIANILGVNKVNIIRVCSKRRKTFRGMQFFYETDSEWFNHIIYQQ